MKKNVQVRIDRKAKRIAIELPRAQILAVEVRAAGERSGLMPQADRSARQLLESLLARDGYTVVVSTRTDLQSPAGGGA